MTNHLQLSAGHGVAVHLLDSAQGHPLQTWRFRDQELITIGRNDGNDVVLSDPHVSRTHATIVFEEGTWQIASIGRHGTIVNDRLIALANLQHRTMFRLGAEGPTLRFDTDTDDLRRSETLDNLSADTLAMLEVDEQRKQQEVEQILGSALFQDLKERSRQSNTANSEDTSA
jgi:pSer/pThr/pTyr-binding forkhead associated (FHA) protein